MYNKRVSNILEFVHWTEHWLKKIRKSIMLRMMMLLYLWILHILELAGIVQFSFISLLFCKTWCGSDVTRPHMISELLLRLYPPPCVQLTDVWTDVNLASSTSLASWSPVRKLLRGIISLLVQYVMELVLSLYRFSFFCSFCAVFNKGVGL